MYRNSLIESHMKLVDYEIARISGIRPGEREDLQAEGYLALVKAADGFDPRRGVLFKSYACAAIRHALWRLRQKDNTNTISLYTEQADGSFLLDQLADGEHPYPEEEYEHRELWEELNKLRDKYAGRKGVVAGIDALLLKQRGFNSTEIGGMWGKPANYVTALISRTRKILKAELSLINEL